MGKITLEMLSERLAELKSEREVVLGKSDPLDKRREKLLAKLQPLEAELREIDKERREVREPLFEIDMEISRITRLLPTDRTVPPVDSGVFQAAQE